MKGLFKYVCLGIMVIFSGMFFNLNNVQAKENTVDLNNVQKIPAFCYHDVVADNDTQILEKDPYAITQKRLEEHFELFKKNGYTPISLKQYGDYLNGRGKLPDKPILLSFDDGRESMYTRIYPLLKKYNYPAVFAIILSYMDTMPPADINKMVTWQQLQEMRDSGLVEVASHTYNLHNFVVANNYGDRYQNVATIWWRDSNGYETENDFNSRITNDMLTGKSLFDENMGSSSNILVWPFGVYTQYAKETAKKAGYEYQLMLNDDVKLDDKSCLSRFIIYGNPSNNDILKMLNHSYPRKAMTAGQVDIDMIYDALPEQFERNISATIEKLQSMNVNTVFLQTFADEDGDGDVDEVYFHTDKMKVKADVFNHVTVKLKEAGFQVYAWMPVLCYPWMSENPDNAIAASEPDKLGWYTRATPFSPQVREYAKGLVRDLALYAPIDGILFQDDLYMNDFEDFSPYAKKVFKEKFGENLTRENLENDKDLMQKWTKLKTDTLNNLTLELIDVAKYYRPELKTARNIYPVVITQPESEEWFAQNYNDYLDLYDYVVIMAYPEMERNEEGLGDISNEEWLDNLVRLSLQNPRAQKKAVFKLQGYDWKNNIWIDDIEQRKRTDIIKNAKGLNIAQYPVNVFDN